MVGWFVGCLVDWFARWLVDCLVGSCRDVWMFGCLVDWLARWLVGWLLACLVGLLAVSTTKLGIENRPSWLSKPLSWRPKSFKVGPKRLPGVFGLPRGFLEGSRGALGPKRAPRAKK